MNYREMSGGTLAYLGDGVISLLVREYLISLGLTKSKQLQETSVAFVSAKGQALFLDCLLQANLLNEEELMIYKRGRNHKSETIPKHTDVITYRKATGLEALFGYWHLSSNTERLKQIFELWRDNVRMTLGLGER